MRLFKNSWYAQQTKQYHFPRENGNFFWHTHYRIALVVSHCWWETSLDWQDIWSTRRYIARFDLRQCQSLKMNKPKIESLSQVQDNSITQENRRVPNIEIGDPDTPKPRDPEWYHSDCREATIETCRQCISIHFASYGSSRWGGHVAWSCLMTSWGFRTVDDIRYQFRSQHLWFSEDACKLICMLIGQYMDVISGW